MALNMRHIRTIARFLRAIDEGMRVVVLEATEGRTFVGVPRNVTDFDGRIVHDDVDAQRHALWITDMKSGMELFIPIFTVDQLDIVTSDDARQYAAHV